MIILYIYIYTVYIYIYIHGGSENRSTPNHPNLDHFSIETHGFGDIYTYIYIIHIHIHTHIYIYMYISLSLNVRTVFQHPSPDSLKKPRGACTETWLGVQQMQISQAWICGDRMVISLEYNGYRLITGIYFCDIWGMYTSFSNTPKWYIKNKNTNISLGCENEVYIPQISGKMMINQWI